MAATLVSFLVCQGFDIDRGSRMTLSTVSAIFTPLVSIALIIVWLMVRLASGDDITPTARVGQPFAFLACRWLPRPRVRRRDAA